MHTPVKPIPKSLPSSAKFPQTDDYVKERQEAMSRLIDVWSSLAEKYSKPLEEDDIVDVLTGEVVKDRGVISNWDKSQQGSFTGNILNRDRPRKDSDTREEKKGTEEEEEEEEETNEQTKEEAEEANEEPLEGEDDEFDELDSFATEVGRDVPHANEIQEAAEHPVDVDNERPLPSANYLTFLDGEDLKEFMEAEKRRKELYGDDESSDSDLEQLRAELRQFRRRTSFVDRAQSDDDVPYPPSSSPLRSSSSSIRASSPTVPPLSPSVGTSSSSARTSLSPFRAFSSFKIPSYPLGRTSVSSAHTSSSRTSSSCSRMPPPSYTNVSSSSSRPPRKTSSLRMSPRLSSPALPIFPSFRTPSVRLSSPDLFTSASVASSSSVRLSASPPPPSSSSSIRSPSPSPSSSFIRSSLPRLPLFPSVRSSSRLSIFDSIESESEDELLGVWTQPEEVVKKSPKSKQRHAIQETLSKTPGPKIKRISKRKRILSSSEEESSDNSSAHSSSVISSSMRAKSLSPKKRIVNKGALYSAYDDTHKDDGRALSKSMLMPSKHIVSNG